MSQQDVNAVVQAIDIDQLKAYLDKASDFEDAKRRVVNAPFEQKLPTAQLFLGIVVLLIANPETQNIDRVALSNTELAKNTTDVSFVPFEQIKTPIHHPDNIIARTIDSDKPHDTTDWYYLFTPALTGDQARINQASGGIAYSAVYPVHFNSGAAMIFSYYQYAHEIGDEQRKFMSAYAEMVGKTLTRTHK